VYDSYEFTGVAGAPIAWQDKTWGVIIVHETISGRAFNREDLGLLTHLGNLAAVALENARRTDYSERLVASASHAIVAVDEVGKVLKFNEQAEKMLGYTSDEVLGKRVDLLYYDLEDARKVKRLLLGSKDGRITDHNTFMRSKIGERILAQLSASLLFDYEGKRAGSVGFFRDLREIESARQQIQQLEAINDTARAILSTVDRREALDRILKDAVERTSSLEGEKALRGSFRVFDANKNSLVLTSMHPSGEHLDAKLMTNEIMLDSDRFDGKVGVTGRVALTKRPRLVLNVFEDADYIAYHPATHSELAVPVLDGERLLGVLNVEHRKPYAFDQNHVLALEALAGLAAIAIKSAERIRSATAIALMGAWGAEVVHEVNREVGNIRRGIFLLNTRPDLPKEVKSKLQEIDRYADGLRLPALPESAEGKGLTDSANLDQIIKTEAEALASIPPVLTLEWDLRCPEVRVAMHSLWLRRLIRHLLRNAKQFIPDERTIRRVIVRTRVRDDMAEVEVEDNGKGVEPDVVPELFEAPIRQRDGHIGRGLLLIRFILEQYGGSIRLVSSRPGEGACFAFRIPFTK
jgi:PAS domain S-box-containing protein